MNDREGRITEEASIVDSPPPQLAELARKEVCEMERVELPSAPSLLIAPPALFAELTRKDACEMERELC